MRVLVCGGRDFSDRKLMDEALRPYRDAEMLIHGCAGGADTLAGRWANFWDVPVAGFAADWDTYGKAAGPLRNQSMIDHGKPDLVVAFLGGRGTADMVRRAKKAGIEVREIANRSLLEREG